MKSLFAKTDILFFVKKYSRTFKNFADQLFGLINII